MDLSQYMTNPALEEEGNWIPVGQGARIKVARFGSRRVARCIEKHCAAYGPGKGLSDIPPEDYEGVLADILAESVLLDWEGISLQDESLPFSVANAKRVLNDPRLRDFRRLVYTASSNAEHFRQAYLEDGEKK